MSRITLHEGDNRDTLRRLIDQGVRVHAVVTDPPYGLTSIVKRFGGEGASAAKYGSDGAFQRAGAGFMGKCYHPDTEILTRLGWKRVAEISVGEEVMTLNPETQVAEWQSVIETPVHDFDGNMVLIDHRSAAQCITPNHDVLTSSTRDGALRLGEAQYLPRAFYQSAQAKPSNGYSGSFEITTRRLYGNKGEVQSESRVFDPDAFCLFLGIFLGDGSVCNRTDDHPANDFFSLSAKKGRKISLFREALIDLDIRFTETLRPDGYTTFYCYDFALLEYLRPLGKAHEKYIPSRVLDLDSRHLEHLYRGLIETDGTRQGKGQEVFFTSSAQLADDFQVLCLLTGRSASVSKKPAIRDLEICGRKTQGREQFVCCVLQAGKRLYCENGTKRKGDVVRLMPWVGKVHCLTVAHHHTLYTRWSGKPAWSGNSWDGTGIERDPEFWKLVLEILLPGGYCIAFSGARTGHWQACAMEQAGFIMHPMTGWVTGSGFPKAHDAAKAIDKELGAEPVVVGHQKFRDIRNGNGRQLGEGIHASARDGEVEYIDHPLTEPATAAAAAAAWQGWKYGAQALKPALEPIYMGQKPLSEKTGVKNLLVHGVGALNIDGCRVPIDEIADASQMRSMEKSAKDRDDGWGMDQDSSTVEVVRAIGRHPANLLISPPENVFILRDDITADSRRELFRWLSENT